MEETQLGSAVTSCGRVGLDETTLEEWSRVLLVQRVTAD